MIRGERKAESEIKEESYYRVERSYGTFYRRIPLPFEASADQITASYNGGVLDVCIPTSVQEQPQPKNIPIS